MKITDKKIKRITIATAQGVCIYSVGEKHPFLDNIIAEIGVIALYFTGDPFDHYVGVDKDNNILFSINPLSPCVVDYLI